MKRYILNLLLLLLMLPVSIAANAQMSAKNETRLIPEGSVIIDMGVVPQTVNNGLKPYGLVYALAINEEIPVIWSISPNKDKDGADFVVDGREFKGGTFIIEKDYVDLPEVKRILNGEKGVPIYDKKGKLIKTEYFGPTIVTRYTTKSDVVVPIYKEIRSFTKWTFDTDNGAIADGYLGNAGIPLTARQQALPNALTACHDIFVLPHADPAWITHGRLYDWVRAKDDATNPDGHGGWLWAGCHAPDGKVGIENMYNTAAGMSNQRTNFLTDRIDGGAIGTTVSLGSSTPSKNPWHYAYPNDVPMQFMGKVDWVLNNGSGPGYLPTTGHKWREGAKVALWDKFINKGVTTITSLIIYGYAYDNPKNGIVMYEAGHSYAGTDPASIAAQRIFLNFLFEGSSRKLPEFTSISPEPDKLTLYEGQTIDFNVLAKGDDNVEVTYQWSQASLDGTFSSTNTPSTTYTAELLSSGVLSKQGTITIVVADPCGRKNILTYPITIIRKNYWHGTVNNEWGLKDNWTANYVPLPGEDIEFATSSNYTSMAERDLHLDQDRIIGDLINDSEVDLVVTTGNSLVINGEVKDNNATGGTIVVKADPENKETNGTLIFKDPAKNQNVTATVEFYNKAYECADCGFYRKSWQYFGIPVKNALFPTEDVPGDETVNQWVEPFNGNKWQPAPYAPDTELQAFKGYEMTNSSTTLPTEVYKFTGILAVGDATVSLTKTSKVNHSGVNLVGNSYTAAIPIATGLSFTTAITDQSVYLFNTGTRDQWKKLNGATTAGLASGQYLNVPIHLAGSGDLPAVIPSMHAFLIQADQPTNLQISYDELVKNELVKDAAGNEIATRSTSQKLPYLMVDVIGEGSVDRVRVFRAKNTTAGFDSGWDGRKWMEEGIAQLYVATPDQDALQVSTVPDFNSIVLGFIPAVDGEYQLDLSWSEELKGGALYLNDLLTGVQKRIAKGGTYVFHAKKGDSVNRFSLSYTENTHSFSEEENLIEVTSTADGQMKVKNESGSSCMLFISTENGTFLQRVEVASRESKTVEDLPAGVYVVRLQNAQVNDVRKVIVKNN